MQATGLSDLQYAEMVMHFANKWMNRYFSHVPVTIDALNRSKYFWKWWTGQWENRDVLFIKERGLLNQSADMVTQGVNLMLYEVHHNPRKLLIVPNTMVVNEVGKLIKRHETELKQLINKP